MTSPKALEKIPEHLQRYIVEQKYDLYTDLDHASWRYIMKISQNFFKDHAHPKYLDGLVTTGISTERIPRIEEMDHCLRRFGWRAVAVSGFIPPSAFLEFEALGILAIACDMRKLENLAYTPAPDIVHEAAGHAPIIADPEYRAYLRRYGEIARKAIFSDQDMNVYEAIRHLSEVKEDPNSTKEAIKASQKQLDEALSAVTYTSEATLVSRMAWWTTEYGLVGPLEKPLIYGAGLLSSVGESYDCYRKNIKKVPMSLDCINTHYDITKPQPQLFVTPDFHTLNEILEDLANQLSFKRGGAESLKIAQMAKTVTTAVLETGIQISGALSKFLTDEKGKPCYLQYTGPCQLAYEDKQLSGHGADYHTQGFGTVLGKIKNPSALKTNQKVKLEFGSQISVEGVLKNKIEKNGKTIVLSFESCTVKKGNQTLFQPSWGTYDMACGEEVVSVFGDAADRAAYVKVTGGYKQPKRSMKSNADDQDPELVELYTQVKKIRESKKSKSLEALKEIQKELDEKFPEDWLLRLEILELSPSKELHKQLKNIAQKSKDAKTLIERGLSLLT